MWTRRKLKERAKVALQRNYWKILLVSILLMLLGCEAGGYSFSTSILKSTDSDSNEEQVEEYSGDEITADDAAGLPGPEEGMVYVADAGGIVPEGIRIRVDEAEVIVGVIMIVVFLIVFFVILTVFIVVDIFLINPFDVGGKRFLRKSIEDAAQVKEIAFAYDHSYKNVVKVMFRRDLYTFLWTLLFVIPGIVKMYQYLMVPYILSETPDMDYREALDKSRDMMNGHKWRAFVLGMSFILWDFLGLLTLGMVEIFYVNPYRNLTFAALYEELKETKETPAMITVS